MESTFVIARRSKCRQNAGHENQRFARAEYLPEPDETASRIQPQHLGDSPPAIHDDTDSEIVLI
jgi:hypothetical protein